MRPEVINSGLIAYQLASFNRGLTFQIHSQEDELTEFVKDCGYFQASNGWKIKSTAHPELKFGYKTIYLRGNNTAKDDLVTRITGLTNSEVSRAVYQIREALKELVAEYKQAQKYSCYYNDTISFYEDDCPNVQYGAGYNRGDSIRIPKVKTRGGGNTVIIMNR